MQYNTQKLVMDEKDIEKNQLETLRGAVEILTFNKDFTVNKSQRIISRK